MDIGVRISLTAGLIVELLLVGVTSLLTGEIGTFGAPLPIGQGSGFGGYAALAGVRGIVALAVFAVDVVLTAAVIWLLMRWTGTGGGIAAGIGGAIGVIVAAVTYVLMASGVLPFAGFPIPVAAHPGEHVALLALWVDCLLLAAAFALIYRRALAARPG